MKITLNPQLGIPIYRQIMDAIKALVASGSLKAGDQLPSIRELAAQLRINPSSAVKAYGELRHAGVITLDQGRGSFVSGEHGLASRSRGELVEKELRACLDKARQLGLSDKETLAILKRLSGGGA